MSVPVTFEEMKQMINVPVGEFTMGALEKDSRAGDKEKPRHHVNISRPFAIGKYLVTQGLWENVMGNNPSGFRGISRPVEEVSWFDCIIFCNKLSEIDGLEKVYSLPNELESTLMKQLDTEDSSINYNHQWRDDEIDAFSSQIVQNLDANGYRLPTEAEWEYAAKAGDDFKHAGSDVADDVAWTLFSRTNERRTHPVGEKKPNSFGIFDMSGNVNEWCWDIFGPYSAEDSENPTGPDSGNYRVRRGGSWDSDSWFARVSDRGGYSPSMRDDSQGFRLCKTIK